MTRRFLKPRLQVRDLPQLEASANYAWREGWWQGLSIGLITGLGLAVILFKGKVF